MTTEQREWVAWILNAVPFVRWDRLAGADGQLAVFGWIDRPDGRFDFVVLNLWFPCEDLPEGSCGYTTSSAKHSDEIGRLLGIPDDTHAPCQRVEHELQGLVENVIHL